MLRNWHSCNCAQDGTKRILARMQGIAQGNDCKEYWQNIPVKLADICGLQKVVSC